MGIYRRAPGIVLIFLVIPQGEPVLGRSVWTTPPPQRKPAPSSSDPWYLEFCQPAKSAGFVPVKSPVVDQDQPDLSLSRLTGVCPTSGSAHRSCVGRPLCRRPRADPSYQRGRVSRLSGPPWTHLVAPGNTASLLKISLAGQGPPPVPLEQGRTGIVGKWDGGLAGA